MKLKLKNPNFSTSKSQQNFFSKQDFKTFMVTKIMRIQTIILNAFKN